MNLLSLPSPFRAEYLSTGANVHSSVADWDRNGVVAFGAHTSIAIWKPGLSPSKGITSLLKGHTGNVKAVKFVPDLPDGALQQQQRCLLVSGADDHSLRLWSSVSSSEYDKDDKDDPSPVFACSQTVAAAHGAPVNCIDVCAPLVMSQTTDSHLDPHPASHYPHLVVSGSADATVKVWSLESGQLSLIQTIETNPRFFPLALALAPLSRRSGHAFLLAVAGTHNAIQVYVSSAEDGKLKFSLQATLTGHEGWIRCLDIVRETGGSGEGGDSDLVLASASQDKYIRLWRICPDTWSSSLVSPGPTTLTTKAHRLRSADLSFVVVFEALLLGHEDWIYSARWHRTAGDDGKLRILSASADNSLAVWEADPGSGIWVSAARLGEISREKGATTATGSTGGFWTGLWAPDGRSVACLTRTGSWRLWTLRTPPGSDGVTMTSEQAWGQAVGVTGHTKAVTGIAWEKSGSYLLSTGLDQTTRLHATWKRARLDGEGGDDGEDGKDRKDRKVDVEGSEACESWHEMSRPQIHGYDLNCIDTLGDTQFVSGADEKLMRVFHEPKAVAGILEKVAGIVPAAADALPDAADVPVLGLSNKAVDATPSGGTTNDGGKSDGDALSLVAASKLGLDDGSGSTNHATLATLTASAATEHPAQQSMHASALPTSRPPSEDILSRYTLWPETEKLYGHGFEISCLAVSHDGKLVASACRASSTNHAVIRVFETTRWTEMRPPLAAHSLTTTRLRFSPDDRFLLSVGRDRLWAVFERRSTTNTITTKTEEEEEGGGQDSSEDGYELRQTMAKAHARMALDAAWVPLEGTVFRKRVFATAGRDKRIKIWTQAKDGRGDFKETGSIPSQEPVTAIDFLPTLSRDGNFVLAVGTEGGGLNMCYLGVEDLAVVGRIEVDASLSPSSSILQLAWRPLHEDRKGHRSQLAIAGEDGSLRIVVGEL